MTKEEIHAIEMRNPTFQIKEGISKNGLKEYFIVANSGGLFQFAEQLTEIASELEQNTDSDKGYLEKLDWITGDIIIDHVNIVRHDSTKEALSEPKKSHFKTEMAKLGCGLVLLIAAASFLVGFVTIIRWLL